MTIYPISTERSLDNPISLSASNINVYNTGSEQIVNILNLTGDIVASFTIGQHERLTVMKPKDFSLSATGDIKVFAVLRTQ
jgi:hypothetical protein